jgi:hypothetical protein
MAFLITLWVHRWRRSAPKTPLARLGQLILWAVLTFIITTAYGLASAFFRAWSLSE